MTDASNTPITINEKELRQIVGEVVENKLKAALADFVTLDDFQRAIDRRPTHEDVNTLALAAVHPMIEDNTAALRSFTQSVNTQLGNIDSWLKTVREEQQRQDKEQDEIKREITAVSMEQTKQSMAHDELVADIFGKNGRESAGSLIAHWDNHHKTTIDKIDVLGQDMRQALQSISENTGKIRADLDTIVPIVEDNKRFRERRQQIERAFIQVIPKAGKRLWEGMTNDWVIKWATRIGLGGALGVLAALLERLQ